MHVTHLDVVIGSFTMDRYMLFMYLGILVASVGLPICRPKEYPFNRWMLFCIGIGVGLASFAGAHALHVIINFPRTKGIFFKALFSPLGFTYLGAPIGALIFLWVVAKLRRLSFWVVADFVVPFFMLERFVGRIGCMLWGCCRGKPTGLPWACSWYGGPQVHPTQAYEMIYVAGIFVAARYIYAQAAAVRSLAFYFVLFSYSAFRFVNAFLRVEGPFMFHSALKWAYPTFFILAMIGYSGMAYALQRIPAEEGTMPAKKLMIGAAIRLIAAMCIAAAIILPVITFVLKGTLVR